MKLLTVDEVTARWKCARITVLRLMQNHTLRCFEGEDGEPVFNEADIRGIKDPRTAVAHLRLVHERTASSSDPTGPSLEELLARRGRANEEFRTLQQHRLTLRAEAEALFESAQVTRKGSPETRRRAWRDSGRGRKLLRTASDTPPEITGIVVNLQKQTQKTEHNAGLLDEQGSSATNEGAIAAQLDADLKRRRKARNKPK